MTCESCAKTYTYTLSCLSCCARLVASARPSKTHQEIMLAYVENYRRYAKNAPTRQEILKFIKENGVEFRNGASTGNAAPSLVKYCLGGQRNDQIEFYTYPRAVA